MRIGLMGGATAAMGSGIMGIGLSHQRRQRRGQSKTVISGHYLFKMARNDGFTLTPLL